MNTQDSLTNNSNSLAEIPGGMLSISNEKDLAAVRGNRHLYPHFCDIEQQTRVRYLFKIIGYCNYLAMNPRDEQLWHIQAVELDSAISADDMNKHLTMTEIINAFRRGLVYGDYRRLEIRTFLTFIDDFLAAKESDYLSIRRKRQEGASLFVQRVDEDKARVWAERMKQWQEEGK